MKQKRRFIFVSLVVLSSTLFSTNAHSQWAKTLGGSGAEEAYSIQQTSDSGYILAGRTGSFGAGSRDFLVVKLSSGGTIQWEKTFGGTNEDTAYSIQETYDSKYGSGYIVAGETKSFGAGNYDFVLLKLNSSGAVQWQKTLGGSTWDMAYSVIQASDTNYVVAGTTASYGAGAGDFLVAKVTIGGGIQWARTFGGTGYEVANAVQESSDGGYILAGYTDSFGAGRNDFLIVKVNSSGAFEWAKTYGGVNNDEAFSIQQTSDGGYIVAGYSWTSASDTDDFLILKLSSSGVIQWQKTFGVVETWREERAYSIQQTSDGGYIVTGSTLDDYGGPPWGFYLIKLTNSGSVQWERIFYKSREGANSIVQTSDGGYAVAGIDDTEVLIAKFDSSGGIEEPCPRIRDITLGNPFVNISTGTPSLAQSTVSLASGNPSLLVANILLTEQLICGPGSGPCAASSAEASSDYSETPSSAVSFGLYGLLALVIGGLLVASWFRRVKKTT
jgi:hypothetical protein